MLIFSRVTLSGVPELLVLSRQTFYDTFAGENTQQNMQKYLEEEITTDRLTNEIQDPESEVFFVKSGHITAGYITLHFVNDTSEPPGKAGLKIERLYITNEFQGKGMGQETLNFALSKARLHHMDYIWLGVRERNYRAIRFYEKNGFIRTGQEVFILGNDVQTDYIMKRYLSRDNEVPNIK